MNPLRRKDRSGSPAQMHRTQARGLPRSLLARLRGEQTLRRLRKLGLRAQDPVSVYAGGGIDGRFAWAIEIGANSTIAAGVRIIAHDAALKRLTGYTEVRPVVIGERCYLGAGAIVLPGAVIGDGAVIGAGALVHGEIPAGSVAVGNPARVIGTVEDLLARHVSLMNSGARFATFPDQLSASELAAVENALREHGRVYVL
jgi:maltose O-acetyltransferase